MTPCCSVTHVTHDSVTYTTSSAEAIEVNAVNFTPAGKDITLVINFDPPEEGSGCAAGNQGQDQLFRISLGHTGRTRQFKALFFLRLPVCRKR